MVYHRPCMKNVFICSKRRRKNRTISIKNWLISRKEVRMNKLWPPRNLLVKLLPGRRLVRVRRARGRWDVRPRRHVRGGARACRSDQPVAADRSSSFPPGHATSWCCRACASPSPPRGRSCILQPPSPIGWAGSMWADPRVASYGRWLQLPHRKGSTAPSLSSAIRSCACCMSLLAPRRSLREASLARSDPS